MDNNNELKKENQEIYNKLANAVVEMDDNLVSELAEQVIEKKIDAFEAIDKGLSKGMEAAGKLFEEEEYFVPELLMCADSMNIGVDKLKPYIVNDELHEKHKIIIGVIEGDTHDIGKNLVKLMLENAGFELIDLGRDVPPQTFIDNAVKENAELILISSLMTTTMEGMADVITLLKEQNIREKFKVCVGGGPVSQSFANKIGADGYSKNAADAIRMCQKLLKIEIKKRV